MCSDAAAGRRKASYNDDSIRTGESSLLESFRKKIQVPDHLPGLTSKPKVLFPTLEVRDTEGGSLDPHFKLFEVVVD